RANEMTFVGDNDTALGMEAAVGGEHGITVGILWMHAFQRQPAPNIIPAVRSLHDEPFPGMFQDSKIDADALQPLVLLLQDRFALSGIPGGSDAQGRCLKLGTPFAQLVENGSRFPDKDAAVPEILSGHHEALRDFVTWFFAERLDLRDAD